MGFVEIKCPYLLLNMWFDEFIDTKNTYFMRNIRNEGNAYSLDRNHSYFVQVQLQMFVTNLNYCDFFVWSETECHINRIHLDMPLCIENIQKTLIFYKHVIKPELLARYFTR